VLLGEGAGGREFIAFSNSPPWWMAVSGESPGKKKKKKKKVFFCLSAALGMTVSDEDQETKVQCLCQPSPGYLRWGAELSVTHDS